MYLNPVGQPIVIALISVFLILGYFVGLNHAERNPNDLNRDGAVTFQDFSIALSLVDSIKNELSVPNQ